MTTILTTQVRTYLQTTYGFQTEQIDLMVTSIKDSLNLEFKNAEEALATLETEILWKAAHSIKGALLNAGLEDWGEFARNIEFSAKEGKDADYKTLFRELKSGVSALL